MGVEQGDRAVAILPYKAAVSSFLSKKLCKVTGLEVHVEGN